MAFTLFILLVSINLLFSNHWFTDFLSKFDEIENELLRSANPLPICIQGTSTNFQEMYAIPIEKMNKA